MKNIRYKKRLSCQSSFFSSCLLFPEHTSNIDLGSIFNFWGNYYNENISRILNRPDEEVLRDDWCIIGQVINDDLEGESNGVSA